MSNTHGTPDLLREIQAHNAEFLPPCIVTTTWPTVPVSSLTLAAFATAGYASRGGDLVYITQPAHPITLPSAAASYYLGLHSDTHSASGSWTRVPGSHYLYLASGTLPADPPGGIRFAEVVVAGGVITAVNVDPVRGSIAQAWRTWIGLGSMAVQNANAVAITGGSAGLNFLGAGVGASPNVPLTFGNTTGHKVYYYENGSIGAGTLVAAGVSVSPSNLDQFVATGGVLRLGTMATNGAYSPGLTLTGSDLAVLRDLTVARYQAVGPLPNDGTAQLRLGFDKTARFGLAVAQQGSDTAPNASVVFYNVGGAVVGYIIANATTTTYATTSDGRLKTAVEPLTGALATVRALRPVTFRWKADDTPGVGLVAQEVQALAPDAVTGTPEGDLPMGLDLAKLVPYLVGAVQQLSQQVEALTARLAALAPAG